MTEMTVGELNGRAAAAHSLHLALLAQEVDAQVGRPCLVCGAAAPVPLALPIPAAILGLAPGEPWPRALAPICDGCLEAAKTDARAGARIGDAMIAAVREGGVKTFEGIEDLEG